MKYRIDQTRTLITLQLSKDNDMICPYKSPLVMTVQPTTLVTKNASAQMTQVMQPCSGLCPYFNVEWDDMYSCLNRIKRLNLTFLAKDPEGMDILDRFRYHRQNNNSERMKDEDLDELKRLYESLKRPCKVDISCGGHRHIILEDEDE